MSRGHSVGSTSTSCVQRTRQLSRERVTRCATILLFLAALVAVSGVARSARGHGPTPGVTGVIVDGDPLPHVVSLTRGLAVRNGDDWTFVCPARWDGVGASRARGSLETGLVVPGPEGPWHLTLHPPEAAPLAVEGVPGARVTAVGASAHDPAHVLWLVATPEMPPRTQLLELDLRPARHGAAPETRMATQLDGLWSDIAMWTDAWRVLRDTQAGSEIGRLDATLSVDEVTALTEVGTGTHGLRTAADVLHLVTVTTGGDVLWRLPEPASGTAEQVASSTSRIHGPVQVASAEGTEMRRFLLVAGGLFELADDGSMTRLDAAERYTCLDRASADETSGSSAQRLAFACTLESLYRVTVDGIDTDTPLFELSSMRPPDMRGLDADQATACESRWLDFAGHASLDPEGPPTIDATASGESCACRGLSSDRRDRWFDWSRAMAVPCMIVAVRLYRRRRRSLQT